MRLLFLSLLMTLGALAQTDVNKLKIIPSSTGTAVGEIDFMSKDNNHHVGIASPDNLTSNHVFRLPPADITGGGCWNTDGSYVTSIGPCGGANSTQVSPAHPLLLNAHFRDDALSLFLDYSRDYTNFRAVNKKALNEGENTRDISVMWDGTTFYFLASPDSYTYWMPQFWTSTDLIHFSARQDIDLTPWICPGAAFRACNSLAGAPEWNTHGTIGMWVHAGYPTAGAWFIAFNPATDGITPTAGQAVTINGTTAVANGQPLTIYDFAPYYDAASNKYYLEYVDAWNVQFIAYASSSTLLGPYTQQSGNSTLLPAQATTCGTLQSNPFIRCGTGDHFSFAGNAEGPSIIALADSVARYGIAGCVRSYADTFRLTLGAGTPVVSGPTPTSPFPSSGLNIYPLLGNRRYTWQYVDTCPAVVGGDPFVNVMPSQIVVNVALDDNGNYDGYHLTWVSGPSFLYLHTGDTLTLHGSTVDPSMTTYTVASVESPASLTLTAQVPGLNYYNLTFDIAGISTPVGIANSEQGTVIALTDQNAANIVYKAADYWQNDAGNMQRLTIGGRGASKYSLTVKSNYASYGFGNGDAATIAAGGPDPGAFPDNNATDAPESFALWSACGIGRQSCPQPSSGLASWINRYTGFGSQLHLDQSRTDIGETSFSLSNGVTVFGPSPIPNSVLGNKSIWRIGMNNQAFGPLPVSSGNTANNWLYFENNGLGAHPSTGSIANPTVSNADFEVGALTGWSATGTASVITSVAHYGTHSAQLSSNSSIYRTITGLTPNKIYIITGWVLSNASANNGVYLTVQYPTGTPNIANYGCNTTDCYARGSWYQIGMQYATDSTGQLLIKFTHPTSTGVAYVDDIEVYGRDTTIGSFALAISPSSGEVRANYGVTLGGGDNTSFNAFASANIDSPLPGLVNLGDGTIGHHNATLQAAGLRLGSSVIADTGLGANGIFEISQTNASGAYTELLHHGNDDNVYLDNYGQAGACTVPSCAPITGGGDIYIRPNSSPTGKVVVTGDFSVNGNFIGPGNINTYGDLTASIGYLDVLGIGGAYSGLPLVVNYNNRAVSGTVGVFQQNSAAITDGALVSFYKQMSTNLFDAVAYSFAPSAIGFSHNIFVGANLYSHLEIAGDTGATIARALARSINDAVDPNANAMQSGNGLYLSPKLSSGALVATACTGTLISTFSNITENNTSKSWSVGVLNGLGVKDFSILENAGPGGYGTARLSIAPGGMVNVGGLTSTLSGASALGGTVKSSLLAVNGGTLSTTNSSFQTLGSFGMDVVGNGGFLGVHTRRQCLSGGGPCSGWTNTTVGLSYDVDNTFGVGAGAFNAGNGIWLNTNGVGINTTLPLYSLDVLGTANVAGTIRSQAQTVPSAGVGTEMLYTGGSGFVVAFDRGANVFKPLSVQGSTLNLYSDSGSVSVTGSLGISGSVSASSGNAGGSIGCTFSTITYMTSPTTSASTAVCTGLTTNVFSHGIRTN